MLHKNFSKIHFNIILPSMRGSFKWSPSFMFSHQNPVEASPLHRTCYMSCSSQFSWFEHPNNSW
jgi:hypothetical protein